MHHRSLHFTDAVSERRDNTPDLRVAGRFEKTWTSSDLSLHVNTRALFSHEEIMSFHFTPESFALLNGKVLKFSINFLSYAHEKSRCEYAIKLFSLAMMFCILANNTYFVFCDSGIIYFFCCFWHIRLVIACSIRHSMSQCLSQLQLHLSEKHAIVILFYTFFCEKYFTCVATQSSRGKNFGGPRETSCLIEKLLSLNGWFFG